MSREYVAIMSNASITSTNTLVALAPNTSNSCVFEIMRAWCSQSGSVTSAQSAVRLVTQYNGAAANQVVGTSCSTQAVKGFNDPTSKLTGSSVAGPGGFATANCTSDGNGAKQTLYADAYNALNGWLWVPTPNETHMIAGYASSQSYGLYVPITPGSLTNWSAGLSYRELG